MEESTLVLICFAWMLIAAAVFVTMFFVTAPFGRHTSDRWGTMIDNKWGWFIMELPSFVIMALFLFLGDLSFSDLRWVLFALWLMHYANRTFAYPLRIRATEKKMPLFVVASAIGFNVVNAGLNGYYLGNVAPADTYGVSWTASAHTWIGAFLFLAGMTINLRSDEYLINLRRPGETGYRIPHGGLFEFVSSPNLFGEILEWSGFALMAWNLPATTFMVWTFANLVPRAKNHHDWYLRSFPDYPKDRRVVFPFLF
jgi:steroid 5-alpha reductase family enzyme